MSWRDAAERALPPPRRSEPANLRADILDELADHLALAAERERERNGNAGEDAVWARVLERFGNPQTLARRLWWDAMKETVMRGWIQTAVVVVACLAVVVFLGFMFRQMQTMNQTLISAMQQQKGADSSGTATLEVTVRRGTASGPLVPNFPVTLAGAIFRNDSDTVVKSTDAQGRVSFGPMQFGNFQLYMNDAETGMFHRREVTLFAGDTQVEVVAPEVRFTEVTLDVGTPALADDALQRVVLMGAARWGDEKNLWEWNQPLLAGRNRTCLTEEQESMVSYYILETTVFDWAIQAKRSFSAEEIPARIPGTSFAIHEAVPVLHLTRAQMNRPDIPDDRWVVPQKGSFGCDGVADYDLKDTTFPLQPGASVSLKVALPEPLSQACAYLARLAASAPLMPILSPEMLQDVLTRYPDWIPVSARPTKAMANIVAGNATGTLSFGDPFSLRECYLYDNDRVLIAINTPITQEECAGLPPDSRVVLAFGKAARDATRSKVSKEGLEVYALTGPWMPAGWPDSLPKDGSEMLCTLARAETPFLQVSAREALSPDKGLFLDMSAWLRGGDGAQPENGLLLRWKSESQREHPALGFGNCHYIEGSNAPPPLWIVLTPVANAGKKE